MIPKLYEATETKFESNGLGALKDFTECKVTEEINGDYTLEMNYLVDGLHFDLLENHRIILAQPNDTDDAQPFDIQNIEVTSDGKLATIYATHVKDRGKGIPVAPFTATGAYNALQGIAEHCMTSNPFTFVNHLTNSSSKFTVSEPKSLSDCLKGSSGSIAQVFSGSGGLELKYDGFDIHVYNSRGANHGVTISYGKNLTEISQETSIEDVYTGCIAYYEKDETVIYGDIAYASSHEEFPHENIYILDASSDFEGEETPTVEDLTKRATEYVEDNELGVPSVSIDVSFVELSNVAEFKDIAMLEHVVLGDTVTVRYSKLGITATAKVKKAVFNVLTEQYESITLGSVKETVAGVISDFFASKGEVEGIRVEAKGNIEEAIKEANKYTDNKVADATTVLEKEIADSADKIKGGTDGHVVLHNTDGSAEDITRDEIIAFDGDSLSTANDVLIMNHEGIAGTDEGINGTYHVAITTDGKINGKQILAETIYGSSIVSNTITVGNLEESLQSDIDEGVQGNEKATANTKSIENLQKQVDGQIETWFYDYAPSDDKAPTNEWTTEAEKNKHIGDLFYDNTTGYSYRYTLQDGVYKWVQLSDSDITKALEEAQKALSEANSKRRVFVTTPTVPYDVGDLWVQGSTEQSEESTVSDDDTDIGDILVCATAKTSDESYNRDDWVLASNYTDDTFAQYVQNIANSAQASAESAQASADSAQASATDAQSKAEEANAKADTNSSAINSLNSQVDGLNDSLNNYQTLAEQTAYAEKVSEQMKTINSQLEAIGNKANDASELTQRIQLNTDGVKISATENSDSYVLIQNDGMRVYVNGKEVAKYLYNQASTTNIYMDGGRVGKHIIEKFKINGVEGTAFFYDENA